MKLLTVVLLLAGVCAGQNAIQNSHDRTHQAEMRIGVLSRELEKLSPPLKKSDLIDVWPCGIGCSKPVAKRRRGLTPSTWEAAVDAIVAEILAEVDRYIRDTVDPNNLDPGRPRDTIQAGLTEVLNPVADMQPVVFVSNDYPKAHSTAASMISRMRRRHPGKAESRSMLPLFRDPRSNSISTAYSNFSLAAVPEPAGITEIAVILTAGLSISFGRRGWRRRRELTGTGGGASAK